MDFQSLLVNVVTMIGVISGVLLGWGLRRSRDAKDESELERLRRAYQEISLDLTRTKEELTRKREIATKIPMIARSLSGTLPVGAIPPIAVRFMMDFFHATHVGFFASRKGENHLTLIEGVGFPEDWKGKIRIDTEDGMLGMAFLNRIVATQDEYHVVRGQFPAGVHSLERHGVSPDIVAPVTMNGKVMGALVVVGSSIHVKEEIAFASMIADLLGSAFQHATTIESVEQSASIDSLTKLYTRGHFSQRFETEVRRAKNYAHPLSILLLDIDHFKSINDTYGHPIGDLILTKLGEILRQSVRSSDIAARFGGEEFVVIMTSASKQQALSFGENLRKTIEAAPFKIPGGNAPLRVTISGGVATYPKDGDTTADLLRVADKALYEAKQTGRNRIVQTQEFGLDGKPLV
jgi:diguanylate cyclase (GGDEF)-like protein